MEKLKGSVVLQIQGRKKINRQGGKRDTFGGKEMCDLSFSVRGQQNVAKTGDPKTGREKKGS